MIAGPRIVGPRKLHVLQGSPEWLAARREHITATDMAAIEGASPWRCEQDVADEKLNGNGAESSLVMRVGNALEDLIATAYAEQTGRKVRRVRGLWESATIPWAAASPDATAAGRLVELKWTGNRSRFRDGLPEDVEIQARWQALVADVAEVDVAALTVGDDEVRIFTVGRDAGIEHYLVERAEDFRARLAAGGPFRQSRDSVRRAYPADNGAEMVADESMASDVHELMALRRQRRALEALEEAHETRIKSRLGEIAVAVGDGFRVTWRKAKDSEATDYAGIARLLMEPMPETERAALVGPFVTVRPGARYLRVTLDKEDSQ